MFKGIARFLVATAAGAGLGAGAALARRHLLGGPAAAAPASWTPSVPMQAEAAESALEASRPLQEPASPATSPPLPSSATGVADLDVARARLRQRAAELRAEMEG